MANDDTPLSASAPAEATPHRRRPRYAGRNPRRFEDKYKEHNPGKYAATVAKVLASGKTPAGMHRPILLPEILEVLVPRPGEIAVDGTLGYGGHAREILSRLQPGGKLIGLDVDPIELPKTKIRLQALGFDEDSFLAVRSNFAGLPQVLASHGIAGADLILADLGVSSMQIDNHSRGFSVKGEGPLDMRMNPGRGFPASALLEKIRPEKLTGLLAENADEPRAAELAVALAGRTFVTTRELSGAIRKALPKLSPAECDLSVRRTFQALRIAVNDEFSALDSFLRNLPQCLNPGGRAAILTFHPRRNGRVKKIFEAGGKGGFWPPPTRGFSRAPEGPVVPPPPPPKTSLGPEIRSGRNPLVPPPPVPIRAWFRSTSQISRSPGPCVAASKRKGWAADNCVPCRTPGADRA